MAKKELWLRNPSGVDVSLSDIGVRVRAGKTINIFAYNPYLTEDKVKLSLAEGSIYKRLKSGAVKKVKGKPSSEKAPNLKVSTTPINVVKSKSSVLVDMRTEEMLEVDDLTGIADYGLGDLEENVKVKTSDGAVIVEQKEDESEPLVPEAEAKIEVTAGQNVSDQSVTVMAKRIKEQSDPIGDLAKSSNIPTPQQPFIVAEVPEAVVEEEPARMEAVAVTLPKPKKAGKEPVVIVEESKSETAKEVKKPTESKVKVKVVDGAIQVEAKTEEEAKEPEPEGMRIATKTESGITVMKIKE
jgi:hypothetical protein